MKRFVAILVALLVLSTQSAFSEERTLNIVFIPNPDFSQNRANLA